MNKLTKMTAILLSLGTMMFPIASLAEEMVAVPVSDEIKSEPYYYSYTGTVKSISENTNGSKVVNVVNKEGAEANFMITNDTYFLNDVEIAKGKEIIGYYESGRPMIMIYPPQYNIEILTSASETANIKVDKFDENLLSKDKFLKLNLSDMTEIVWEKGTTINWFAAPTISQIAAVLSNRKLIVLYDFTTKSIPAQTTPKKIIVLSQQEQNLSDHEVTEILINNNPINAPQAYKNASGALMIPLRAVAEALGFEITWNQENQNILVGKDISLTIGEDRYILANSASVSLGAVPELKDDRTFVPVNFFKDIIRMKQAVSIDNKLYFE